MRFLGGKPYSREESWRHMAHMLGHWRLLGYGMWALQEKSTGALLGRVGFNNPEGWPGFEVTPLFGVDLCVYGIDRPSFS